NMGDAQSEAGYTPSAPPEINSLYSGPSIAEKVTVPSYQYFPAELLAQIFAYLVEEVLVPPVMNQSLWCLGRVCSWWRSVSRGNRRLWGCPKIDLEDMPAEDLESILPLFPSATHFTLICTPYCRISDIRAYLHRCEALEYDGDIKYFDRLLKSTSPDSFRNLRSALIDLRTRGNVTATSDKSWTFRRALLPASSQLRQLDLIAAINVTADILASLGLPWSQLKALRLDVKLNLNELHSFLGQCTAVHDLCVFIDQTHALGDLQDPNLELHLPDLQRLELFGVGMTKFIPLIHNWQPITHLRLTGGNIPAAQLHGILEQSKHLEELMVLLPPSFPFSAIRLPVLHSLRIVNRIDSSEPLRNFILPRLDRLYIFLLLDLVGVHEMLVASQCFPSSLSVRLRSGTSAQFLRAFFAAAPKVSTLDTGRAILDAYILHDIGAGLLLPHLTSLTGSFDSVDAVLAMISARLAHDPNFWDNHGFNLVIDELSEVQNDGIKKLCLSHSIRCDIVPLDSFGPRNPWAVIIGKKTSTQQ
ncbi:hypothetical protein H0H92_008391, partial [Tricholoma furcatifolium]